MLGYKMSLECGPFVRYSFIIELKNKDNSSVTNPTVGRIIYKLLNYRNKKKEVEFVLSSREGFFLENHVTVTVMDNL